MRRRLLNNINTTKIELEYITINVICEDVDIWTHYIQNGVYIEFQSTQISSGDYAKYYKYTTATQDTFNDIEDGVQIKLGDDLQYKDPEISIQIVKGDEYNINLCLIDSGVMLNSIHLGTGNEGSTIPWYI